MSLRTLPVSVPNHLLITTPKLPRPQAKSSFIFCKSTESSSQNVLGTHFPASDPEPEGTRAAAPTRGDLFLERQQATNAAKILLKGSSKKPKKKKPLRVYDTSVAACYGCGARLQSSDLDAPGYVDSDTYELKKKHHQLRTVLCRRCQLLSHGHILTAVGGHGGYSGGKQFVLAEQLRQHLSHLRFEKALIIKLVDIVDFNGSFLTRVRDLVGANPIILVVTKIDLLPRGTELSCVGDWVVEAVAKKKLNVLSIHLTSSKSLVGIAGVASEIQKEKKGRDVYILGAANVGKSAFISSLLKIMAERDPVSAAAQKHKPIQSAVPGTTLGPIKIDAFLGEGKLYDTPGVHLHHRQAAVVHSEDLPVLAPRSRLKGQSFPSSQGATLDDTDKLRSSGLTGFSIFWGGLVRVDILKAHPDTCLTFYGPKAVKLHMVPTNEADQFYQTEVGVLLTPPSGKESASTWMGLEAERQLQMTFNDGKRPACDIAISGLGWISVEPVNKMSKFSDTSVEEVNKELDLMVHVPKAVEIFVRPPMPVSKAGAEWYQYEELTEEEEAIRPKLYY